jgi:hypothetical protein
MKTNGFFSQPKATSYNNIGLVFKQSKKNFKEAIKYFEKD